MNFISELFKILLIVLVIFYVNKKCKEHELAKPYELKLKPNAVMCSRGVHPVEKGKRCTLCVAKKSLFSNELYCTDLRQLDLYQ